MKLSDRATSPSPTRQVGLIGTGYPCIWRLCLRGHVRRQRRKSRGHRPRSLPKIGWRRLRALATNEGSSGELHAPDVVPVEVEKIEGEHDRVAGRQFATAATKRVLQPAEIRSPFLVEHYRFPVKDGGTDAEALGRILDPWKTMRRLKPTKPQTDEGVSSSIRQGGQFLDSLDKERETGLDAVRHRTKGSRGWEGSRGFRGRLRSGFSSARRGLGRGDFAIPQVSHRFLKMQ